MTIPEIVTTMLGASGVGKTTLLTSIYEQFSNINQEVNFEFHPDSATEEILQKNLKDLKSMADEITAREGTRGIAGTAAVAGPDSLPEFIFYLCKKRASVVQIDFSRLSRKLRFIKQSRRQRISEKTAQGICGCHCFYRYSSDDRTS